MRRTLVALAALAGASLLTSGAASAFTAAPIGDAMSPIEQVRLVCNEWGRCWRTGPRYYRSGYYGPRRYEYDAPRYGYYGGPGPGVVVGAPGFGLRFGY